MGSTPVEGKEAWVKGEAEWDADPVEASRNPAGNLAGCPLEQVGAGERGLSPY